MVKFSFLLEHVDIKDGTKMLSQTVSDELTCAMEKRKKKERKKKTQVFGDFN